MIETRRESLSVLFSDDAGNEGGDDFEFMENMSISSLRRQNSSAIEKKRDGRYIDVVALYCLVCGMIEAFVTIVGVAWFGLI